MKFATKLMPAAALLYAAVLLTTSLPAQAQNTGMAGMSGMTHSTDKAASAGDSASTMAYKKGSEQMMQDMQANYTGDADKDFAAQMLAHHIGAVSMAQVELDYGKDPEMRKLARDIIKAQKKEIALMKKWQAKHAAK